MSKITKQLRAEIVANVTKGAFVNEFKELSLHEQQLALECVEHEVGKADYAELRRLMKAHPTFVHSSSEVNLCLSRLRGIDICASFPSSVPRSSDYHVRVSKPELVKRGEALVALRSTLAAKRTTLVSDIGAVIDAYTNLEKLCETFPAIKPNVPIYAFGPVVKYLPAVTTLAALAKKMSGAGLVVA